MERRLRFPGASTINRESICLPTTTGPGDKKQLCPGDKQSCPGDNQPRPGDKHHALVATFCPSGVLVFRRQSGREKYDVARSNVSYEGVNPVIRLIVFHAVNFQLYSADHESIWCSHSCLPRKLGSCGSNVGVLSVSAI